MLVKFKKLRNKYKKKINIVSLLIMLQHKVKVIYFDPIGIEKRPILMMDGFAGQQVVIDFNNYYFI